MREAGCTEVTPHHVDGVHVNFIGYTKGKRSERIGVVVPIPLLLRVAEVLTDLGDEHIAAHPTSVNHALWHLEQHRKATYPCSTCPDHVRAKHCRVDDVAED